MIESKKNNIILNTTLNIEDEKLSNNKLFGLWIYLMSDCIMFAVLFAVHFIITSNIPINLINNPIINFNYILLETFLLLLSSLSCGLVSIKMYQKKINMIYLYLAITFILGLIFLLLEVHEFYELVVNNFGPDKNAFFSIFFTIVGMHGIHIFFGLILILSIFYQIRKLNLTSSICNRILCLSIFWHFLDIIWICVFTFVYLNGAI